MQDLGFDILIVDNRQYSDHAVSALFNLFAPLGIKKFIFLCDFDFTRDSFSVALDKISRFKERLKALTPERPAGIHSYVKLELQFDIGAVHNPQLSRLYASRSQKSLFVSLPIFINASDNAFASDLNRLLYRSDAFPIFTEAQNIAETAPSDFYSRLLSTGAGFAFDLNYLLRTEEPRPIKNIISNNILILPMISHELENYVSIEKHIAYFQECLTKSDYYRLCTQINRCALRAGL